MGLPGDFLFDDLPNLKALDSFGEINSLEQLKLYLSYSSAGPTGRPISLLSFLVNADSWPDDAGPFKITNILLHLLNGIILFWFISLIFKNSSHLKEIKHGIWIALFASIWWAAHPLHVSTVLYIIQRMAILSALFSLLGMVGYIYGRIRYLTSPKSGYLVMAMSISLGTLFATLSKENGALLPLFILIIESLLFSNKADSTTFKRFKILSLWTPSIVIVLYLIWAGLNQPDSIVEFRGFTVYERLLTESQVLIEYLKILLIPQPYTGGLYQYYPISKSISENPIVLVSIFIILSLLSIAWVYRARQPLISVSVFFFFAAHLIESTTVPLELYYEHRNYLPSAFLFVPFSFLAIKLIDHKPKSGTFIPILISVVLVVMTAIRCQSWSNSTELQLNWARENPLSHRAQLAAAENLINKNEVATAKKVLTAALGTVADDTPIRLHLIRLTKETPELKANRISSLASLIKAAPYSNETLAATVLLSQQIVSSDSKLNILAMLDLWDAVASNPRFSSVPQNMSKIHHNKAHLLLALDKTVDAVDQFQQSLEENPSVNMGIVQSTLLADKGHYCESIKHLIFTQRVIPFDPKGRYNKKYYDKEISRLIRLIQIDADTSGMQCDN
ncbi:hypothetical protein [Sedimenticola hydrogenitrophicus]|uniref:hypothetical protein n=1 Tax=Sedimenticola hydrogenitrophicus TaxID=2967975 RepID=UPI0023B0C83F|nr:hypothetical protein [Sedimenticola hydrogenitrophicus]